MEVDLTYEDKHLLQATINAEVHRMKAKRSALAVRFNDGHIAEKNYLSGKAALTARIQHLHDLKHKLGCFTGFGMYAKALLEESAKKT